MRHTIFNTRNVLHNHQLNGAFELSKRQPLDRLLAKLKGLDLIKSTN